MFRIAISCLLLVNNLQALAAPRICAEGETRCSADSHVQICQAGFNGAWIDTYRTCAANVEVQKLQRICSAGEKRCGSDGMIEECKSGGSGTDPTWRSIFQRCK